MVVRNECVYVCKRIVGSVILQFYFKCFENKIKKQIWLKLFACCLFFVCLYVTHYTRQDSPTPFKRFGGVERFPCGDELSCQQFLKLNEVTN